VAVGWRPAGVSSGLTAVIVRNRFSTNHEFHVRAKVRLADLHYVVTFLPQRPGDRPVAADQDVHDGHADTEILDIGDHLREIFFRAHHESVGNRTIARKNGEIPANLALDPFPAAWPHGTEPELHPGQVGKGVMFCRPVAFDGGLVPVTAKQRQAGPVPGHAPQELEDARVIPGHRFPIAGSVDSHRAICQHVARVHEQRAPIHGHRPSVTRDVTSGQPRP